MGASRILGSGHGVCLVVVCAVGSWQEWSVLGKCGWFLKRVVDCWSVVLRKFFQGGQQDWILFGKTIPSLARLIRMCGVWFSFRLFEVILLHWEYRSSCISVHFFIKLFYVTSEIG